MKALGITALVVCGLAIIVPVIGPWLTIVSALLAAFAAGPGLIFAVIAILLNVVNIIFLSPSLWLVVSVSHSDTPADTGALLSAMGTLLLGPQLVAAILLTITHLLRRKRTAGGAT